MGTRGEYEGQTLTLMRASRCEMPGAGHVSHRIFIPPWDLGVIHIAETDGA